MTRSGSVAARAVRFLRERGPDNPAPSFELADAIGIDRYTVGAHLNRAIDRGLIVKIRTPGVKQVSWIATAAALAEAPAQQPLPRAGDAPRFGFFDWPPDFVPTLHRAAGLPDLPEWQAIEAAIQARAVARINGR